jgi:hypothetical protein
MKSIVFIILLLLAGSLSLFFFLKDNEETNDEVNSATSTSLSTSNATTPNVTTPKATQSIIKYFDISYYFNRGASRDTSRETRRSATHSGTRATTHAGTRATTHAGTRATTHSGTHATTHSGTHATTPEGTQATTPTGTPPVASHAATYPSVYTTTSPNSTPTTSNSETIIESFVVKDSSDNTYDVPEGSEIYNTDGSLYIGKHDPTNYGELLSALDDKYEELKDRVPPKCDTSIKCIADFGTNIGEDLCCGQTGVLQDTKYVCPSNKPTCGNFKCGSQFGQCS